MPPPRITWIWNSMVEDLIFNLPSHSKDILYPSPPSRNTPHLNPHLQDHLLFLGDYFFFLALACHIVSTAHVFTQPLNLYTFARLLSSSSLFILETIALEFNDRIILCLRILLIVRCIVSWPRIFSGGKLRWALQSLLIFWSMWCVSPEFHWCRSLANEFSHLHSHSSTPTNEI